MFQIWSVFYILLLLLSVFLLIVETEPSFRVPFGAGPNSTVNSICRLGSDGPDVNNTTNPKTVMYFTTRFHPIAKLINTILTFFFLAELIIRFIVWPDKLKFFLSLFNIIDLVSVIPLAVVAVINLVDACYFVANDVVMAYYVASISSVFRCLRVLKLIKHNRGLRVLTLALQASAREIILLLLLVCMAMVIFATTIYYAELSSQTLNFRSIPSGFWWSIITMTTVGYGDVVPQTLVGCIIGGVCALCGMFVTGLPIPVIASNFNLYYTYAKLRERMRSRKSVHITSMCDLCRIEAERRCRGHCGKSNEALDT